MKMIAYTILQQRSAQRSFGALPPSSTFSRPSTGSMGILHAFRYEKHAFSYASRAGGYRAIAQICSDDFGQS